MGEGSYITLFSASDVTAFHRIGELGGIKGTYLSRHKVEDTSFNPEE